MARETPDVKVEPVEDPETGRTLFVVVLWRRCRGFFDTHPRTGWYITVFLALNYVIDALQSGLF